VVSTLTPKVQSTTIRATLSSVTTSPLSLPPTTTHYVTNYKTTFTSVQSHMVPLSPSSSLQLQPPISSPSSSSSSSPSSLPSSGSKQINHLSLKPNKNLSKQQVGPEFIFLVIYLNFILLLCYKNV